jgi:tetratricopeptide (TPR) repeat protein
MILAMLESGSTRSELSVMQSLAAASPDVGASRYNLGNALWREGRLDEAIAEYRRAADLMPESSKAYNNLGLVLAQKGEYDEALASYGRALALRQKESAETSEARSGSPLVPGSAFSTKTRMSVIHTNMGDALARSDRPEEALQHYRTALEMDPQSAKIQASIGATLGDMGRFDEGVTELRKALLLDPAYATAHINLAALLAHLGQTEEARKHFQLAAEHGDARARQAAQAALEQLRPSP